MFAVSRTANNSEFFPTPSTPDSIFRLCNFTDEFTHLVLTYLQISDKWQTELVYCEIEPREW